MEFTKFGLDKVLPQDTQAQNTALRSIILKMQEDMMILEHRGGQPSQKQQQLQNDYDQLIINLSSIKQSYKSILAEKQNLEHQYQKQQVRQTQLVQQQIENQKEISQLQVQLNMMKYCEKQKLSKESDNQAYTFQTILQVPCDNIDAEQLQNQNQKLLQENQSLITKNQQLRENVLNTFKAAQLESIAGLQQMLQIKDDTITKLQTQIVTLQQEQQQDLAVIIAKYEKQQHDDNQNVNKMLEDSINEQKSIFEKQLNKLETSYRQQLAELKLAYTEINVDGNYSIDVCQSLFEQVKEQKQIISDLQKKEKELVAKMSLAQNVQQGKEEQQKVLIQQLQLKLQQRQADAARLSNQVTYLQLLLNQQIQRGNTSTAEKMQLSDGNMKTMDEYESKALTEARHRISEYKEIVGQMTSQIQSLQQPLDQSKQKKSITSNDFFGEDLQHEHQLLNESESAEKSSVNLVDEQNDLIEASDNQQEKVSQINNVQSEHNEVQNNEYHKKLEECEENKKIEESNCIIMQIKCNDSVSIKVLQFSNLLLETNESSGKVRVEQDEYVVLDVNGEQTELKASLSEGEIEIGGHKLWVVFSKADEIVM